MRKTWMWIVAAALAAGACGKDKGTEQGKAQGAPAPAPELKRAEAMPHSADPNNIVSIAVASKDHTTLVAALKAADYVTAVGNPGPLTVFAPTDEAFKKLPAGTVENLVKPENVDQLKNVLKYHVTTSVYDAAKLTDGLELGMANGGKTQIKVVDGVITINGAKVVASVRASNGIVHVVDGVLVPPAP